MKRIFSQCLKELAQFRRDRLTLALAFLLPMMTLLILGFAIRLEAKNIPLLVQDYDQSVLSREYRDRLFATNVFTAVTWTGNTEEALDKSIARAVVLIPPDFSRRLKANQSIAIQVIVDGTDANNARVIRNYVKATTQNFLETENLMNITPIIRAATRLWFNPGRAESLYIVPGVYAVVLWIYPSLLSAINMVSEKEKGTILQIYASDLRVDELIIGKSLAYLLVGLSIAVSIMGLGHLIFSIRFVGDLTPLLLGTIIYVWASVMFGLMLGARTNSQNAAVQGVSLVGFLTAVLLSGFIYPLNNIPFPLSLVSYIVPARYYIEITRDATLRGIGWPVVGTDLLIIFLLGIVPFMVTRKALSRMQLGE